jgi:hypothetical protein
MAVRTVLKGRIMKQAASQSVIILIDSFLETSSVPRDGFGLCHNLELGVIPYEIECEILESWEHFSGCITYPVPMTISVKEMKTHPNSNCYSAKEDHAEFSYDYLPLYEGKQLELRISLAKHIKAKLEGLS